MKDYYKILGLKRFDTSNLDNVFKNNLNKYKNLPFYSEKVKKEIFSIKEAHYVLSNRSLVEIYNSKLKENNKYNLVENLSRSDLRDNRNNIIYSRNFAIKQKKKRIFQTRKN